MTEAEWLGCTDPPTMGALLRGTISPRKLWLTAAAWAQAMPMSSPTPSDLASEALLRYADSAFSPEDGEACRIGILRLQEIMIAEQDFERAALLRGVRDGPERGDSYTIEACFADLSWMPQGSDVNQRTCDLVREIFGSPFRPVVLDPRWQTANALDLARTIYEEKAFERLPILADALMDAGCDDEAVLAHCRQPAGHVRGCWVVDLILGKV